MGVSMTKSQEQEVKPVTKKPVEKKEEHKEDPSLLDLQMHEAMDAVIQEAVYSEISKKHKVEKNILTQLIQHVSKKSDEVQINSKEMTEKELKTELHKLGKLRSRWKKDSVKAADVADYKILNPEELSEHLERNSLRQERQTEILQLAMIFRTEVLRRAVTQIKGDDIPADRLKDAIAQSLYEDLQNKQLAEKNAMNRVMDVKKNDNIFYNLRDEQRRARREGWLDNLAKTVLTNILPTSLDPENCSIASEDVREILEREELMKEIDEELEKQKEDIEKDTIPVGNNAEAMLAELERQHAAKKQAMQDQLEMQKRQAREKLMARRQKQEAKDYENELAVSLVQDAEKSKQLQKEKEMAERDRQGDLMKQRLAERKKQRQKQSEEKK